MYPTYSKYSVSQGFVCTVQYKHGAAAPPTITPGLVTEFAQIPDTETGHANYTSSTIHNRIGTFWRFPVCGWGGG
jgi:hypothetical protein